ncbi:MAG: hypothetical protein GXO78_13845 [Calditrichaeota bacterium]|nr:hypothetical protein [Calditrichota bacterium]
MTFRQWLTHKPTLYAIIVLGITVLMGLNLWGYFFLNRLEREILSQLNGQFKHMQQIATRLFNGEELEAIHPGDETRPGVLYYQQLLWEIKQNSGLNDILILTLDGRILIDHRVDFTIGASQQRFPTRNPRFLQALEGEFPEPELIEFDGDFYLIGYTPIFNSLYGNVSAVLVAEMPTHFFATLQFFRRGLFLLGVGAMALILIFSAVIVLAIRQLLNTERQLQEQQRLAELGQMSAMVAHEIRNPLSIIKGTAEVLKRQYASEQNEMFNFIPEEIDRLNRLVNEFLQFARRTRLTPQKIVPDTLIQQMVQQLNDPHIQFTAGAGNQAVLLDADAFKQILLNVISNARKAIPEKDGRIQIHTQMHRGRRPRYVVRVQDNGTGMDRETLEHIFDPFFSRSATGSGLGMTITRRLTEQMGGQIHIDSEPGKGTTVTLSFPV